MELLSKQDNLRFLSGWENTCGNRNDKVLLITVIDNTKHK